MGILQYILMVVALCPLAYAMELKDKLKKEEELSETRRRKLVQQAAEIENYKLEVLGLRADLRIAQNKIKQYESNREA